MYAEKLHGVATAGPGFWRGELHEPLKLPGPAGECSGLTEFAAQAAGGAWRRVKAHKVASRCFSRVAPASRGFIPASRRNGFDTSPQPSPRSRRKGCQYRTSLGLLAAGFCRLSSVCRRLMTRQSSACRPLASDNFFFQCLLAGMASAPRLRASSVKLLLQALDFSPVGGVSRHFSPKMALISRPEVLVFSPVPTFPACFLCFFIFAAPGSARRRGWRISLRRWRPADGRPVFPAHGWVISRDAPARSTG
jgi:hypothetical protein